MVDDTPGRQLERVEGGSTLFRTDDPDESMQRATAAATALKNALSQQGMITKIQGRDHVNVEGWQTLGSLVGAYPRVRENAVRALSRPADLENEAITGQLKLGRTFGFVAYCEVVNRDGMVIGGAEGRCDRSENTWRTRDDSALSSMAQTRALSKAMRAPLGFIVQLAGYSATPAEEMGRDDQTAPAKPIPASDALMVEVERVLGEIVDHPRNQATLIAKIAKDNGGVIPQNVGRAIVLLGAAWTASQKPEGEGG